MMILQGLDLVLQGLNLVTELCQRRVAFFFQHRARISLAGARATALRTGAPPRPPVGNSQ